MKLKNKVLGIGAVVIIWLAVDLVFLGGLRGSLNTLKGPEDNYKNHYARSLLESIDRSISAELEKSPPSGYLSKGYSREIWDIFWNRRINTFSDFGKNIREGSAMEHYRGPTGEEFIQYIIEKRRERGLPEINIEERNKIIIEELTDKQLIQVEQ